MSFTIIAHRGNLYGPDKTQENKLEYIEQAINLGFDAEIDLWYHPYSDIMYLGHDKPENVVSLSWLREHKSNLWIHCKCLDSLDLMARLNENFNYFWHETDKYTMTSHGIGWVYPGNYPYRNSIIVMPESVSPFTYNKEHFSKSLGVCTDLPFEYKSKFENL